MLPATILWGASFPLDHRCRRRAAIPDARSRRSTRSTPPGRSPARWSSRWSASRASGARLRNKRWSSAPHSRASPVLLSLRSATSVFSVISVASCCHRDLRVLGTGSTRPSDRLRSIGEFVGSIKRFLYLEEGATASVAVTEGVAGAKQFHIAGKVEASDMDVDMRLERMLGHVPALLHPHPRSILIVGVGAGVTAGALSIHPEVERIVICEIERVVPESARVVLR